MNDIDKLRDVILRLHGCAAYHAETVPVKEVFQGQTLWEGEVEVFNIRGHPKARRCYAWSHETDGERRYVAVLELPPVDSAQTAVRAAIVEEVRNNADNIKENWKAADARR
ncbi:MAG: hypothetical protein H7Z38_19525 [Rubrivivax sp.]|nr:hypothetical protein [Pyrinomonadaceae bacterium]